LPAGTNEGEEKGKRIAESNLGQRVFKGEIGDGTLGVPQEDAEHHKQKTAPDCMAEHALECGTLFLTAPYGIGKGNTDQEREGWLICVMKAHADPLGVGLVIGQNALDIDKVIWE
jgi:hypothetical protein